MNGEPGPDAGAGTAGGARRPTLDAFLDDLLPPGGGPPGAVAAGVAEAVLLALDDSPQLAERVLGGLEELDRSCRRARGMPFHQVDEAGRHDLLAQLARGSPPPGWRASAPPPRDFWAALRGLAVAAYCGGPAGQALTGFPGPAVDRGGYRHTVVEPDPLAHTLGATARPIPSTATPQPIPAPTPAPSESAAGRRSPPGGGRSGRFAPGPPADVCIVGAGAAGGLLARLLAEAGLSVVLLEAGPWYPEPRTAFVEDELAMRRLWWPEAQYGLSGDAARSRVNTGFGVGGGSLLWTGAAFRLFSEDFEVLSRDGQLPGASLADWPLGYADLEPDYDAVEAHIGVAGAVSPWDPPGRRPPPLPPHGYHRHTVVLRGGFERLGLRTHPGPVAIASRPLPGREACCGCGFCIQGCRTGAMWSSAAAELPAALATGRVELRPETVALRVLTRGDGGAVESVEVGEARTGRTALVPARAVVVAANPVETARLLLNSASPRHPRGLANGSGQVGRNFMAHPGAQCWGVFEEAVNPWEGFVLNHLCCLDEAQTVAGRPYIRGFAMETSTALPVGLGTGGAAHLWGRPLLRLMGRYRHVAGLFTICEGVPMPTNRVTLDEGRRDRWGLPEAHLHYDWHTNDVRLVDAAAARSLEVLRAAGAVEAWRQPPSRIHMMGTARMGDDPVTSVVDADGAAHEVDGLFLAGGALFPTGSSVNPTLTILALAWRTARAVLRRLGAPAADPAPARPPRGEE